MSMKPGAPVPSPEECLEYLQRSKDKYLRDLEKYPDGQIGTPKGRKVRNVK
jgi:hypothetical protein